MDLLGDWWTPLVLREAFYGIRRFDEFQNTLGIARNTLTDRLTRLVDEGLLEKQAYQAQPTRYDYVLTEKGRDFFGVLAAMSRWGDRWLAGTAGPPITFHHDTCDQDVHAEVVCSGCGEQLRSEDTGMRMGPGYPEKLKNHPEVVRRFPA
jgi:DNA-binding HxlR family transcriptional regulator